MMTNPTAERPPGEDQPRPTPCPRLTEAQLRELLGELLAQLLTQGDMEDTLDFLLAGMDYGRRPWNRFTVTPQILERVKAELAAQILALGREIR